MRIMSFVLAAAAALTIAVSMSASAGAGGIYTKPQNVSREDAPKHLCMQGKRIFSELTLNEMMEYVHAYHEEAVTASQTSQSSRSMRFTWALETKAWCGVAIGFAKTRSLDEETIAKCACFHWTMINQR